MSLQSSPKDLWSLVREIPVCMLTTRDGDLLRSRPMATRLDEDKQEFLFLTSSSSPKAHEIGERTHVNLSFSDPEKDLFISVSGEGQLAPDHDLARQLWNSYAAAYFPKGPDSEEVAVLRVLPKKAEYWVGGKPQQVECDELRKATGTGTQPDLGLNEKVEL